MPNVALDPAGLFQDSMPLLGTLQQAVASGTFTMTGTGFTANPTGTAIWQRVGRMVFLVCPSLTGTSNSTAFTLTGLPAVITPSQTVWLPVRVQSGGVDADGLAQVTSGSLTLNVFATFAAAAFSATLGKTLYPTTLIYPIG